MLKDELMEWGLYLPCALKCAVFFFVCNFYGFNEHKKDQIDRDLTGVVIVEENHLSFPLSVKSVNDYQQTVIWRQI